MKIAVRYQSRNGNTKAVAEAIANAAGIKAESIEVPLAEPIDLLFVGGGFYFFDLDHSLKDYLVNLSPDSVKSVAAFSTAGTMDATPSIAKIVKTKGIQVCEKSLPIKLGGRNHKFYQTIGVREKSNLTLTDKQLQLVDDFVKSLQGK